MRRVRAAWWSGAFAFAGIVAAHALTYQVVDHGHGARHALLDELFGLTAAAAVLVAFVVRTARSAGPGPLPVRHLALAQVVGWLLVEGLERLAAGHGALVDPALLLGLLVQVVVAVVGVVLLRLVAEVVRLVVRAGGGRRKRAPRRRAPVVLNGCWPRFSPAVPRGPPVG